MVPQKNFMFADKATEAFISNDCINQTSDIMDLQLSGNFTSCNVVLKGKVDINADYEPLMVINLGKFTAVDAMEEAGIYEAAISGLQMLQVEIVSVEGEITIVGRMLKEV